MDVNIYKLSLSLILATILGSLFSLIDAYLATESKLFINIFVLVAIDTIMGVIVAYNLKVVSSTKFSKVITKLLVYVLLIIAVNQGHINNPNDGLRVMMQWFDNVVYSTILIREILSILEKATKLKFIKLPAKLMERLEQFESEVTENKK